MFFFYSSFDGRTVESECAMCVLYIGAKYGFSISEQRNRNTWLSLGIITDGLIKDQMYVFADSPAAPIADKNLFHSQQKNICRAK